jgi:hypothetical protein
MNRAIGALGQRLAQHLLGARRAGGDHHHLAAVLLLLAQRFFERVGVRLVDLVGNVLANPRPRLVELEGSIFLRDLLHAYQDLHALTPWGKQESINESTDRRNRRDRTKPPESRLAAPDYVFSDFGDDGDFGDPGDSIQKRHRLHA